MSDLGSSSETVDFDGDGYAETTLIDVTGDGTVDVSATDTNFDGMADVIATDLDGDNVVDVIGVDTNGDGAVDMLVQPEIETVDTTAPVADPWPVVDPMADPDADVVADPFVHGEPVSDLQWAIEQSENGFCMPVSVAMIASEFTGQPVSEATAVEAAVGLKLLDGGPGQWTGMTAPEGEALLEYFGIEAHTEQGDLDTLRQYLDEDRGVILGIDSSEIWDRVDDDGTVQGNQADHAVVITGIDDATGMVTLNDPGHPEGAGMQVPISVLEDAWADSGNTMVVTDGVPVGTQSEFSGGFVLLPIALTASPR